MSNPTHPEPDSRREKKTRWFRKPRWYRNPWVRAAVILVIIGIFAAPKIGRMYVYWSSVRRAKDELAKGDVERAMFNARVAFGLKPMNPEVNRIIAECLEAAGSPVAYEWRKRLNSLTPGDTDNLIAWAKDSLAAGFPDTAAEVMGMVKPEDRNRAGYHDMMARLAVTRRNEAEAETHWKEAARLDPKEERFRLSLAVLRAQYGDIQAREEAMDALRELAVKPGSAHAAQRAMLSDALGRDDRPAAKDAASKIALAPGSTIKDNLLQLSVLQQLGDPEFLNVLAKLRERAVSNPEELYQLLLWMNGHGLVSVAAEWLRELPRDVISAPPVCAAVADARVRMKDWETLLQEVEIGKWGASEFARLAYQALAEEKVGERDASAKSWAQAVTFTEQNPERIEVLSKLAFSWQWEERGTQMLWKLTATGLASRPVLDALWAVAARQARTDQMLAISKLRMKSDPRSIVARNNFAFLSMLSRNTEKGIHEIAEVLYKEAPDNPGVVATYALSLYERDKITEALNAMQALKPEQLRDPGAARYLGIFLAALGREAEAAEYIALGEKDIVLKEEKALLEQARLAGQELVRRRNLVPGRANEPQ